MIKKFFHSFFIKIVYPYYQIFAILLTSTILMFMAYNAMQEFHSTEKTPPMQLLTPNIMKEWVGQPAVVKIGLHVINFPEVDLSENRFVMDATIWFEFDPAHISIKTVEKFTFEKGEIQKKSAPSTRLINDKLFVKYDIRVRFSSNVNYETFPFDDHKIFLVLANPFVLPSDMFFESTKSGFTISKKVTIAGWTITGNDVDTGYEEAYLDTHDPEKIVRYPKVIFHFDFRRSGISQVFLIFLPLFLIFFIGLYSLGFDPPDESKNVMSLSAATIGSLISYRFVIQRMSPVVGYFLLSDYIFLLILTLAFIVLFWSISLVKIGNITPTLQTIRGILFIGFHITIITTWYYLLFVWI